MIPIVIILLFLTALLVASFCYAKARVTTDTLITPPYYCRNVKDITVKTEDGGERVIGVDADISSIEVHDMEERTTQVYQERRYTSWD